MEDSTRLTDPNEHHRHHHTHHNHHHDYRHRLQQQQHQNLQQQQQQQQQQPQQRQQHSRHNQRDVSGHRVDLIDDECSTDSGCSSGGSTGSAERLSRRGSAERLCRVSRSPRSHCYLDRFRGRPTRSQDRLSSVQRSTERTRAKSSRSWSPSDVRGHHQHGSGESPSYSPSLSDAHSSSDSDSLKRSSTTATLRRALQTLKISSKWESGKDKKHAKKSPKRILRSPVSYTYVRGLSGLPTQRVPRNATQQLMMPCSCQDSIGLYR